MGYQASKQAITKRTTAMLMCTVTSGRKGMGYTSIYIYRDDMGSVSGMESRELNPISLKEYGIFYEFYKNQIVN